MFVIELHYFRNIDKDIDVYLEKNVVLFKKNYNY